MTNNPLIRINIPFNVITLAVVSIFFRPQEGRGGSVSCRMQSLDLGGCFIFVTALDATFATPLLTPVMRIRY